MNLNDLFAKFPALRKLPSDRLREILEQVLFDRLVDEEPSPELEAALEPLRSRILSRVRESCRSSSGDAQESDTTSDDLTDTPTSTAPEVPPMSAPRSFGSFGEVDQASSGHPGRPVAVSDWDRVLGRLQPKLSPDCFDFWVRGGGMTFHSVEDGVMKIRVAGDSRRRRFELRCARPLREAAREALATDVQIQVLVEMPTPSKDEIRLPEMGAHLSTSLLYPPLSGREEPRPLVTIGAGKQRFSGTEGSPSFDDFIVGPSNQLAHAAAVAVSHEPAAVCNPLFMHGDRGVGKTHLLQAICGEITARDQRARVVFVPAGAVPVSLVPAQRDSGVDLADWNGIREGDVIVIDDFQAIGQKSDRTQAWLFESFENLRASGRQLVISSCHPPQEMTSLREELAGFLRQGMVAPIRLPDYETRLEIISSKAKSFGMEFPFEVVELLAELIPNDVHALASVVVIAVDLAELKDVPVTIDLAFEAKREWDVLGQSCRIDSSYPFEVGDGTSTCWKRAGLRRKKRFLVARQLTMYLAHRLARSELAPDGGDLFKAYEQIHRTLAASGEVKDRADRLIDRVCRILIRSGSDRPKSLATEPRESP